MKDVFLSRSSWLTRRKDILSEIHNLFVKNKKRFISIIKKKGFNNDLYSLIMNEIYSFLMKKTNLLNNLTDDQMILVKKFIIVIFLLTRNPPFIRRQISILSELNVRTINNIINYLKIDIPKYTRKRFQIFNTIIENANFLNKILDSGLRKALLLVQNQAPSKKQLIESGYQQFIYSIERNINFKYSDVIKQAGLIPYNHIKFRQYFMEKFCRNLMNYIKNKTSENIEKDDILESLLRETTYISLLGISDIPESFIINNNFLICLEVIGFAILKCSNYDNLSHELMLFTGKSDRTIKRYMHNYLPLLEKLYGIEINHWLPRPIHNNYTFYDLKREVKKTGFILIYPKTAKEFNLLLSQISSVYKMYITIHCGHPTHPEYKIRFDSILNGLPCKYCSGYSLSIDDIESEVKLTGLKKSGKEGSLLKPRTFKEFEELKKLTGIQPAYLPLIVKCGVSNHPSWETNYHNIKNDNWCIICASRYIAVGNYIHPIFEYITLKQLCANNCSAKFEYDVNSDKCSIIDISIKRNENFIKNIERNQFLISIPEHIEEICIDFTISTEFKNIKPKFYKNYQAYNKFLLIILIRINNKTNKSIIRELRENFNALSDISFKENIKLLSLDEFLNFLNLSSNLFRINPLNNEEKEVIFEINKISKLIEESLVSDIIISRLEKKKCFYKKLLQEYS